MTAAQRRPRLTEAEAHALLARHLEKMIGEALGRLGPDSGKTLQLLDEIPMDGQRQVTRVLQECRFLSRFPVEQITDNVSVSRQPTPPLLDWP